MAKAAKSVELSIIGDKELLKKFSSMKFRMQKKLVKKAMRPAIKIVLEDARRLVPVDFGALKKGLKISVLRGGRFFFGLSVVHPTRQRLAELQPTFERSGAVLEGKGYYPAAVEYGAPHAPAQPHLRPALNNNRERCKNIFVQFIRDIVRSAE